MNILVAYATYSGSTEGTAEYIARLLEKDGHTVTKKNIADTSSDEIRTVDLCLLGSPSWLQGGKQGQPHAFFFDFFETHADESFDNVRIALFGLGDQTYTYYCGAVDIIGDFFTKRNASIIIEPLRMENIYIDSDEKETQVEEWVKKLSQHL